MEIKRRTVDRGTAYQREVCIDLDTPAGRQEELEAKIADFLSNRIRGRGGATARHRAGGYQARRAARRMAHEGWMHKAADEPNRKEPHPFYGSM